MKVEVLEKKLKDAGFDLTEGDRVTVPDEVGAQWCAAGWAKDLDGNVETGERVVTGAELQPHKAQVGSWAKES